MKELKVEEVAQEYRRDISNRKEEAAKMKGKGARERERGREVAKN